jgi:hypothetical protein
MLTVDEVRKLFDPPLDRHRLHALFGAMKFRPCATRPTGGRGRPAHLYSFDETTALVNANRPFMSDQQ